MPDAADLTWVFSKEGVPGSLLIIVCAILFIDGQNDVCLHTNHSLSLRSFALYDCAALKTWGHCLQLAARVPKQHKQQVSYMTQTERVCLDESPHG